MAQHSFQMGGRGHAGGPSIDPNNLAMSGYQSNFAGHTTSPNSFSNGSAFLDDELLEGLASPTEHRGPGMQGQSQDYSGGMSDINFDQAMYSQHGLPMDHNVNHFSSASDGNAIHSPFIQTGFANYRHLSQSTQYTAPLQSPLSFAGSPLANPDLGNDNDAGYMSRKPRARMAQAVQRNDSSNRSPLPGKTGPVGGLSIDANAGFGAQPIQAGRSPAHTRDVPQSWAAHTPNSLTSFPPSSFNSPLAAGLHGAQAAQISDMLLKGGASMPTKIGPPLVGSSNAVISSQEAKRKRRRESHNLVERRRRDNINERIQDLSKLVPDHRLEDEKVRKAIQNGTPLSPTLGAVASPTQATSGLAGPGLRRAAVGSMAGNITTGLPLEDKDKGPNKGDILNGAVSWMRDLMWMVHLKLQQQEELFNCIQENGGIVPFEVTEDELRMQSELLDTINRLEDGVNREYLSYSRTSGSGLRVPHHTDIKGDSLNGDSSASSVGLGAEKPVTTPDEDDLDVAVHGRDPLDSADFFDYDEDDNTAPFVDIKDDYGTNMDTTA